MPPLLEQLLLPITLLMVGAIVLGVFSTALSGRSAGEGSYPYEANTCLFTPAERSFLGALDQVIGSEYRVFGKVRVADVLGVTKGMTRSEWRRAFNRIQSKHFDFVVCRACDSSIVLVIELDDKSHRMAQRVGRDDFIEKAVGAAGTPLLRIPCRRSYSTQEIHSLVALHISDMNSAKDAQ